MAGQLGCSGPWSRARAVEQARGVRRQERVHGAVVPALVLGSPAVIEVAGAFAVSARRVQVEGQHDPERGASGVGGVGLGEDAKGVGRVVVETEHPFVGPEVVVEGSVLLHDEDHVFDGPEIGSGRRGHLSSGDGRRRASGH